MAFVDLFSYDLASQTISVYNYRGKPFLKYKIGELFVGFLNSNYEVYDKKRELLRSICISQNWKNKFYELFPSEKNTICEKMVNDWGQGYLPTILFVDAQTPYFDGHIDTHSLENESVYHLLRDKGTFDLKYLQKRILNTYVTCIDIDIIKNDSPIKKYMKNEGFSYEMAGLHFTEETKFRYKYTFGEAYEYDSSHQTSFVDEFEIASNPFWEHAADDDYPDFMKYPKVNVECAQRDVEIIHGYTFKTVQEALQCEFLKMLELGIKIRKCAVCGKYFILSGHNAKCCDNLYEDTGLTCQQVFANRNYKNKRKENPIMKEYDKAYKRIYARYSKAKGASPTNSAEFKKWKEEALAERDRVAKTYLQNPSDDLINEFKKFLNNK